MSTPELASSAPTTPAVTASPPAPEPIADKPAQAPQPVDHGEKKGSRWWLWVAAAIALVLAIVFGAPKVRESLDTVSTDDAYVNGHVTFVAPRISGQVARVLVDDNMRVRKGALLVQLDRQPYQVQQDIAQAAVDAAQSDLIATQAQARGLASQIRSMRFNLDRSVEDVHNQVALLHSKVAFLESQRANLANAKSDYERAIPLVAPGAITQQELDHRKQAYLVVKAQVDEALQGVYQVRVSLGLPPIPEDPNNLAQTPADLDQTFSLVRQAQSSLLQAAAQLGVSDSFNKTPKEMIANFYKRDPEGNIDRIFEKLLKDAPTVRQAESKMMQAQRKLDEAKLNLSYCDIVAEIDGVVTRRNVNPGNNVISGQSLLALRSTTEVWIDANFKETQLSELRIGQLVELYVDMYGSDQHFKGRISGFTMGTGSTLALLPPENATGNFVKVVQRLPVRIDLTDYDPDKTPLFIGLSVRPVVRIKEAPAGPSAGKVLQPYAEAGAQEARQ